MKRSSSVLVDFIRGKNRVRMIFLLACLGGIVVPVASQPYVDLVNMQHIISPDYGIHSKQKSPATLRNFSIQSTLPVPLSNNKDLVIISPFFDCWSPRLSAPNINTKADYYSTGLPLSLLKTMKNEQWSVLLTMIVRKNASQLSGDDNWQIGGAALANFKVDEGVTYKAGIYINREFFGLFVMPLLGIDWQFNKKTALFGVLPGNLTLEHQLTKQLFGGATFRAITSSFKTATGFWRLDENRLGMFVDFYVLKNIVVSAETGHSVLRKMRTGVHERKYSDWLVNDNFYFKVNLAYRLRLR